MSHSPIVTQPSTEVRSSENEGGSTDPAELAKSLGVVRHMTETYSVGRFRYSSLVDAIAQARRMTKLERELI